LTTGGDITSTVAVEPFRWRNHQRERDLLPGKAHDRGSH
jgi:hypothetical protein